MCSVFALKCTGWHLFVVAPLWHCNSVGFPPPPFFFFFPSARMGASAGEGERKWVIKQRAKRLTGASDAGIWLIAPK